MRSNRKIRCVALGALLSLGAATAADETVHRQSTQAEFDDVRFGIESAIRNRGYVIDYHARVGEMLARTAADVGAEETLYTNAETWQFCSSILSRRMMEIDPANLAFCPYVVFAYATHDDPDTVVVGFRSNASGGDEASAEVLGAIDRELEAIVAEAIE